MKVRYLLLLSIFFLQACENQKNTYQGYVFATNTYISSKFEGEMQNLVVKRGDKVKKGDLLYSLESKPQSFLLNESTALLNQSIAKLHDLQKPKREPALNIIRAKIKQVEAQIHLAQLREHRNQTLYNKKVLAKDSLDFSHEHLNELLAKKQQLEAELDLSMLGARNDIINAQKAAIESLEIKTNNLTWVLDSKKGYAPEDGVIYDTYFVEGELVTKAKPILAILSSKNIEIEFFAPYDDVKNLYVGQEISYAYMGNNQDYKPAIISYISAEAEYIPPLVYSRENTNKIVFKIKAKPSKDEQLTPGLPVTISTDTRPLRRLASSSNCAKNRSTESTKQFETKVDFPKRSIKHA